MAVMYDAAIRDATLIGKKSNYKDLPLLGFVMSLKENFVFEGTDSTSGFAINLNSHLIDSLRWLSY